MFLRDDPLSDLNSSEDAFGHKEYSEALADAVVEAKSGFTLGVFGDWGIGKTTIAKDNLRLLLQQRLGRKKVAFAYFDVWKYEGDSLQRQFIRDVGRQFRTQHALHGWDEDKEDDELLGDVGRFREALGFSLRSVV